MDTSKAGPPSQDPGPHPSLLVCPQAPLPIYNQEEKPGRATLWPQDLQCLDLKTKALRIPRACTSKQWEEHVRVRRSKLSWPCLDWTYMELGHSRSHSPEASGHCHALWLWTSTGATSRVPPGDEPGGTAQHCGDQVVRVESTLFSGPIPAPGSQGVPHTWTCRLKLAKAGQAPATHQPDMHLPRGRDPALMCRCSIHLFVMCSSPG